MKWDFLFTYAVLSRGRQYFKDGRVSGLNEEDGIWTAWVEGTADYQVSVATVAKGAPRMSCTCPYAGDNHKCKHMAAVLYAIEEKEKKSHRITMEDVKKKEGWEEKSPAAASNPRVWPFEEQKTGDYHYYDLSRITADQIFYQNSLEEARRGIANGQIRLERFDTGYESRLDPRSLVARSVSQVKMRGYEWRVQVCFNRERILMAGCLVPGCNCNYSTQQAGTYYNRNNWGNSRQALCSHVLAALLLTEKQLKDQNPGDATDRSAQKLLNAYRRQRALQKSREELPLTPSPISLEPRMTLDPDGILLSFRIGTDKLYVVKNLTELVSCVEKKQVLELGTKTKVDCALHCFAGKSLEYYEFIRDIVLGEQSRSRYSGRNGYVTEEEHFKGEIPLYGRRLDDFFDLAKGLRIELTDKVYGSDKRPVRFREADPQLTLCVTGEEEDGEFSGIAVSGQLPELLEGERCSYYLSSKHFNRISKEMEEKIAPLIDMADFESRISFRIGRRNMSEFYYHVLPLLEECVEVREENTKTIHDFLPPEAEFSFYLDAERQNVTCRARVAYGDQQFDLPVGQREEPPRADFRDALREEEVCSELEKLFGEYDPDQQQFDCNNDSDRIYNLLESGLSRLMELGEVQTTDRLKTLRIRGNARVTVGVSVDSQVMNLEILSQDLSREELLDILYHYQRKKKYYRLKNGDFLNLQQESLSELSAMLDALQISPREFAAGKMQLPLYRTLYMDRMLEQTENLYSVRDGSFRALVKEYKTVGDSDYEVPAALRDVMRNYQVYGYKWLRTLEQNHFGGILADDMGLGKTLQVIAVLLAHKLTTPGETSLVVCPASLVYNWREEFARFAPDLSVGIIAGPQQVRSELLAEWNAKDVLITSYDLLKRDIAEYEDMEFAYQVIDEAQYIKNHTTAAAKAVKLIRSRTRFALTGTPIENRLSELWSIFEYLMPGFLYSYEVFRRDLELPVVKTQDPDALRQLKRMVSPFILRRLKKDVLKDLPEKLEEVRYIHMEESQRRLYDGQVARMQQMLREQSSEEFGRNRLQILAELTRIRQICCDPSLLVENYQGESAKRQACMDMIRSAMEGEHKMLIFSQFTSMLSLLEEDLQKEGIAYYKITGPTPKEERIELVRAFNEDDTPVFLISLRAGGTGLNLTGADVVIHYDPWWNVAAQNQATDRAHRIGQTRVVSVYRMIIKDSVEEKILHMQEEKQNLAEEVLSGELGGLAGMSREDLLALLE